MMFAGVLWDRPVKLGSFRNLSCERVQRAGGMSWCVGMVKGNRGETLVRGAFRGTGFTNAPPGLRVADAWSKDFAINY
jgi:hypothetical protein